MSKQTLTPILLAAALAALAHTGPAQAYFTANVVVDQGGGNANAVDMASVNCFDNGSGPPHHLAAFVQDTSGPAPGLLVSLQLLKDTQITTVTDAASADGQWSPVAVLAGGAGTYYMSVQKTTAGTRNFQIAWDCQTASNASTGMQIQVLQFQ